MFDDRTYNYNTWKDMPPKKKAKRAKFLKKDRESMVKHLISQEEDDLNSTVKEVKERLQAGVHLKYKESWKRFVESVCGEQGTEPFSECVQGNGTFK